MLAVLIAAYNAEQTLGEVLARIQGLSPEDCIIVVDDGSTDRTAQIAAKDRRVHLLQHQRNAGYGRTSMALYDEALRLGATVMVNVHADLAHFPEEIQRVIGPVLRDEADLVIGCRTLGLLAQSPRFLGSQWLGACLAGVMPVSRLIPNLILTGYQNLCYGTSFHSFHDGFRACHRRVVETLPFQQLTPWYEFDTSFLLAAHKAGFRITEVGVSTQYLKRATTAAPRLRYGLRVVTHATASAAQRLLRRNPSHLSKDNRDVDRHKTVWTRSAATGEPAISSEHLVNEPGEGP